MSFKDIDLEKEMTGYSSIDKPWQKFYSRIAIEGELPKTSVYNYMYSNSLNHQDTVAINYFANKIKYLKLIKNIATVAASYSSLGIKENDVVSFCVPTLPESIYSFYGLNKIGAVSCFIDPRTGAERIKKCLNASKAKVLVTIDLAIPKIDKILDGTNIDKVISLPATNSLPMGLNYVYKGKKAIEDLFSKASYMSGYVDWSSFVKNGKDISDDSVYNAPAAIVYTSGTTSDPKGVVISNDALNALAYQYETSPVPHDKGDRFLNVMPTFLLYGLACGIHMPLSLGMTNIVIPQVDFDKFPSLVLKHKPNHFMVNPILFDKLVNDPKMQDEDLSFIVSPGIGGSGISLEKEKEYNRFLDEHYCHHKLAKGYGATEGGSAVVAVLSNECDCLGSAGIPLPKNTVAIFNYSVDNEGNIIRSDEELKYNQEGEVCVCGPTIMSEYLNNKELTDEVLRRHSDGKLWLHTGDRGYINENGNVFVYDRIGRMIITPDSHNIYLASIESVINNHEAIKDCAVVGVPVEGFDKGRLPKAVIVLRDEYKNASKEIVDELIDKCNDELPERDVARYYEVVDSLPVTLGGKVDYPKLEQGVTGQFFDANIKISNLVEAKVLKK